MGSDPTIGEEGEEEAFEGEEEEEEPEEAGHPRDASFAYQEPVMRPTKRLRPSVAPHLLRCICEAEVLGGLQRGARPAPKLAGAAQYLASKPSVPSSSISVQGTVFYDTGEGYIDKDGH
eukprot:s938_g4.t1